MSKATPLRLAVAVVIVLALLLGGQAVASAEGEGVITGKVLNKTQGGSPVGGLEVSLITMAHQSPGPSVTTTTDGEGNFRFDKLVTAANFAYRVGVTHNDVEYGSEVILFQSGESQKTADIAVYDTTTKLDSIVIERAHVILGQPADDQIIPVMEILILTNKGAHAIVPNGPDEPTIRVSLPPEAQGLQLAPEIAAGAVEADGGFGFAQPIMPGVNELLYSYELPYQDATFDLNRMFHYPIEQITLLSPDQGLKLSSDQLVAQPPRSINGQNYLNLLGENLAAESKVTIHIEGLSVPSPLSALLAKVGWAQPAIAGLIVVAVLAFLFLRRRGQGQGDEDEYDAYEDAADGDVGDELDEADLDEELEVEEPRRRGR